MTFGSSDAPGTSATLSSDPGHILIASDAWCTRTLLRACDSLSHTQFHQRFDIGPGSLHATLTHIIDIARRWTDRLAQRPLRPALSLAPGDAPRGTETTERTPAQLLHFLDDAEADLHAVYARVKHALDTVVSLDWPGEPGTVKVYTFSRGAVIAHVTTHGYHHRAQCLNMLRLLGAPVPGVTTGWPGPAVVDWQAAVESPAVIRRV